MIVLVSNIGTTTFKFKLFDMAKGESVLAEGAADRIGQGKSAWWMTAGASPKVSGTTDLADHAAAIELLLGELTKAGVIKSIDEVQAIGFKAVHGGPLSVVRVDERVLRVMRDFSDVTPLHNPPYIAAMEAFAKRLPKVPQVAAFETSFHQTIPLKRQAYAIPYEWTEKLGIRRYGFHGASHRYIATRMKELAPSVRKIVNLHLGGSCSVCAIEDGKSVANSFGMTTQTGIPHAARVGDFDAFAMMKLLKQGIDLDTIWKKLGKESGMLGMAGSQDMRDVETKAAAGDARAKLAVEVFVEACRHYLGAYLVVLNGADAITFTGGIGQNGSAIRAAILEGMEWAGVRLDPEKNKTTRGNIEGRLDDGQGRVQIWMLPTNEELIVARQTVATLTGT
ncbi:MAG TPA: acetate/propionate family kinase [Phycisphaerae bacterium]|nr:acetate/propionate family kinase [Phycisphaerae bacterium]